MPISNLKYQLRVKDKYKHWFPLEDPTSYWESINKELKDRYWELRDKDEPYAMLDLMIEVCERTIEFNSNPHSPADDNPGMILLFPYTFDKFKIKSGCYVPMDSLIRKRIQERYKAYVNKFDPGAYSELFDS